MSMSKNQERKWPDDFKRIDMASEPTMTKEEIQGMIKKVQDLDAKVGVVQSGDVIVIRVGESVIVANGYYIAEEDDNKIIVEAPKEPHSTLLH